MNYGWTHPSARDAAPEIPGPHSAALAEAARSAGLWVVAGLVEGEGDRLYNTALLLDPEGADCAAASQDQRAEVGA
ncbi:MAG: nitrilase-related carbon-nitrogen hydrolase [Bryobacterales bacterium]